jgi:hypothetical protein
MDPLSDPHAVFLWVKCCVAGVLIGIPISIQRKSYKPFAVLGVLGTAQKAAVGGMDVETDLCAFRGRRFFCGLLDSVHK